MRSIRFRILITCLVLVIAGVGGWQLLPSSKTEQKAISVGTTDVVSSLDPAGAYDAGSWALFGNIYQSLLTFKPSSVTPEPDAARKCGFTDADLRTYVCEVRDDVSFSNGHKMTGEDVKYSFDRMLKINSDLGPASLFPSLKSVDAEGQKVTFHLSARDATFPYTIATGAGAIVDHTTYPGEQLRKGSTVDGSGPYLLTQYTEGADLSLTPNPKYRGAASRSGGPVDLHFYESSEEMAAAWTSRTLEVTLEQLPPSLIAGLDATRGDIRVNESEGAEIRHMVFNLKKGSAMEDKAVRQAVAALLDRPKIVTDIYDSTVDPLYSLIPVGITSHSTPFFDVYPKPDAARAEELLADAGIATPVEFTLGHARNGSAGPEGEELRRQLEATGLFKVKIVEKEWTDFQKDYSTGKYDAYTVGWVPDFPDPDSFVAPVVGRDNAFHNGYDSSQVNQLIEASQQFSDRGRATDDFKALQVAVAQDVPILPLWQKKVYVLSAESIAGSQYLSDGAGLWRFWELGRI
ncbi:ABC transporter substrate-binding protein [Streptomyces sp. NPDC051569]|uniref:ABC transporter substrate-binding protein n=1 Tax=Streptomyces sp. NPDC051569 TaxID=3365661 RepID=UPI00378D7671